MVLLMCLITSSGCISLLSSASESGNEKTNKLVGGVGDFVVPTLIGAIVGGFPGAVIGLVLGVPIYFIDLEIYEKEGLGE